MPAELVEPSMRTVFHIGFPKSASTLLQYELFDQHPSINAIGKPNHRTNPDIHKLIDTLRFTDSSSFRYNPAGYDLFQKVQDDAKLNVLSCEDFSSATYWETAINKIADRSSIATNLHALDPEARILVIVREPVSCLKSIYAQLATNNRLPGFGAWIDEQLERVGSGSILEMLVYRDVLETYARLFGKERLIVLEFEDVIRDARDKFANTAQRLGIAPLANGATAPRNKRRTKMETTMRRMFNRNSFVKPIIQSSPASVKNGLSRVISMGSTLSTEFSEEQLAAVNTFFAPGITALRTDWDLGHDWGC